MCHKLGFELKLLFSSLLMFDFFSADGVAGEGSNSAPVSGGSPVSKRRVFSG